MKKIFNHLKENWIRHGFETLVVTVGILGAFTLNNWNEIRKNEIESKEIYEDLLISLRKDSIQLNRIISIQRRSLDGMEVFITRSLDNLHDSLSYEEISSLLDDVVLGGLSFFPRNGVYTMIITENKMQLIESEIMKSSLIDLYDYQYKRYLVIDDVLDHKYFNELDPFLIRFLGRTAGGGKTLRPLDIKLFDKNYDELGFQCSSIYLMAQSSYSVLINFQKMVNELINEITAELAR